MVGACCELKSLPAADCPLVHLRDDKEQQPHGAGVTCNMDGHAHLHAGPSADRMHMRFVHSVIPVQVQACARHRCERMRPDARAMQNLKQHNSIAEKQQGALHAGGSHLAIQLHLADACNCHHAAEPACDEMLDNLMPCMLCIPFPRAALRSGIQQGIQTALYMRTIL